MYSSPAMSFLIPTPSPLGTAPRCFGRSSYLVDILFGKARASSEMANEVVAMNNDAHDLRVSRLEIIGSFGLMSTDFGFAGDLILAE